MQEKKQEKTIEENRDSQRHRVLRAGTIEFSGGGISCQIRDLSPSGACLEVTSQIGIPPSFTLVTEPEHFVQPCHVVWRKDKRIGVAFD